MRQVNLSYNLITLEALYSGYRRTTEKVMVRKRYGVALGTDTIASFTGKSEIYDSLKTELGLIDAQGEGTESKNVIRTAVSKVPNFSRIGIAYKASATKTATGRIICATSKIEDALKSLPSKTYNGKAITRAYIPRKVIYI